MGSKATCAAAPAIRTSSQSVREAAVTAVDRSRMSATVFGSCIRRREDPAADHRRRPSTPTISCCPAWCTRRSFAALTRTPGSTSIDISRARASRTRRRSRPTRPPTPTDVLNPMPCAWLLPDSDLKIANTRARQGRRALCRRHASRWSSPRRRYQAQDAARPDRRRLRVAAGGRRPAEARSKPARRSCMRNSRTIRRFTGRLPAATSTRRSPTPRSSSRNASSSSG